MPTLRHTHAHEPDVHAHEHSHGTLVHSHPHRHSAGIDHDDPYAHDRSPALVADGNHARVDGYVSLSVIAGAALAAVGLDRADPLIGLAITIVILKITWDSWRVISTTEPGEAAQPHELWANGVCGVSPSLSTLPSRTRRVIGIAGTRTWCSCRGGGRDRRRVASRGSGSARSR